MSAMNDTKNSPAAAAAGNSRQTSGQQHLTVAGRRNNTAAALVRGNSVVTLNQIYQHQNSIPVRNRILSTAKSLQQQSIDMPDGQPPPTQPPPTQPSSTRPSYHQHSNANLNHNNSATVQQQQQQQQKSPRTSAGQAKSLPVAPLMPKANPPPPTQQQLQPPVRIINVARRNRRRTSGSTAVMVAVEVASRLHGAGGWSSSSSDVSSSSTNSSSSASTSSPSASSLEESPTSGATHAADTTTTSPTHRSPQHLNHGQNLSRPVSPGIQTGSAPQSTLGGGGSSPSRRRILPVSPQHSVAGLSAGAGSRTIAQPTAQNQSHPHQHPYGRQSTVAAPPLPPTHSVMSRQSSALNMRQYEQVSGHQQQQASISAHESPIKRHRKLPQIPVQSAGSAPLVQQPINWSTGGAQFAALQQQPRLPRPAPPLPASQQVVQQQEQQLRVQSFPLTPSTQQQQQQQQQQQPVNGTQQRATPQTVRAPAGWQQRNSGGSSGANSTDTPSPRSPVLQPGRRGGGGGAPTLATVSSSNSVSATTTTTTSNSIGSPHAAHAAALGPAEMGVSSHFFTFDHHLDDPQLAHQHPPYVSSSSRNLAVQTTGSGAPLDPLTACRSPGAPPSRATSTGNTPTGEQTTTTMTTTDQSGAATQASGGGLVATTPRGRRLSSCGLGLRANFLMNKQHAVSEFTPPRSLESSNSRSSTDAPPAQWPQPPAQQTSAHLSPTIQQQRAYLSNSSSMTQQRQHYFNQLPMIATAVLFNRRPSGHGLPQRAASASETSTSGGGGGGVSTYQHIDPLIAASSHLPTAAYLYSGAGVCAVSGGAGGGGCLSSGTGVELAALKVNPTSRSMVTVPHGSGIVHGNRATGSDAALDPWHWPAAAATSTSGRGGLQLPLAAANVSHSQQLSSNSRLAAPNLTGSQRQQRLSAGSGGGSSGGGAQSIHNALSIDVYQCNSVEDPLSSPSQTVPMTSVNNATNLPINSSNNSNNLLAVSPSAGRPSLALQQRASLTIPDAGGHLQAPGSTRDRQPSNVSTNSMPAGTSFALAAADQLLPAKTFTSGASIQSSTANGGGAGAGGDQPTSRKFGAWAERIAAASNRKSAIKGADEEEESDDSISGHWSRARSACQLAGATGSGVGGVGVGGGGGVGVRTLSACTGTPTRGGTPQHHHNNSGKRHRHKHHHHHHHHHKQATPAANQRRRRSSLRNVASSYLAKRLSSTVNRNSSTSSSSSSSSSCSSFTSRSSSSSSAAASSPTRPPLPVPDERHSEARRSMARFNVITSSHRKQQQLIRLTASAFSGTKFTSPDDALSLADRLKLAEKSANKLFRKVDLSPKHRSSGADALAAAAAAAAAVDCEAEAEVRVDEDDDNNNKKATQRFKAQLAAVNSAAAKLENNNNNKTNDNNNNTTDDDLSLFLKQVDRRLKQSSAAIEPTSGPDVQARPTAPMHVGGVSLDRSGVSGATTRAIKRAMTLRSLVKSLSRRTSSCDAATACATPGAHSQGRGQEQEPSRNYANLLSVATDVRQRRSAECLAAVEFGDNNNNNNNDNIACRRESVKRRAARLFRRTKTTTVQQQQQQQQQLRTNYLAGAGVSTTSPPELNSGGQQVSPGGDSILPQARRVADELIMKSSSSSSPRHHIDSLGDFNNASSRQQQQQQQQCRQWPTTRTLSISGNANANANSTLDLQHDERSKQLARMKSGE